MILSMKILLYKLLQYVSFYVFLIDKVNRKFRNIHAYLTFAFFTNDMQFKKVTCVKIN